MSFCDFCLKGADYKGTNHGWSIRSLHEEKISCYWAIISWLIMISICPFKRTVSILWSLTPEVSIYDHTVGILLSVFFRSIFHIWKRNQQFRTISLSQKIYIIYTIYDVLMKWYKSLLTKWGHYQNRLFQVSQLRRFLAVANSW